VPTYAYACSACEHAFDIQQSFSDDALTVCPQCERESLRKVFSPVGVVFKGSGFYRTDSRANATKAKAKGASAPSTTSASSGGGAASGSDSGSSASSGSSSPSTSSSGATATGAA
jgi:putative FmdB family regulatory protein